MTIYVQETGTAGVPSIVFLHGVGASGWMWWMQTPAFTDYHCLVVDLPGHGKSAHVPWVSFADAADHVAGVIRDRATDGRAHVVGLSLGGHVALALLARHVSAVERVILSGVTAAPWANRWLLRPQVWLLSALRKSRRFLTMQARSLGLHPDQHAAFTENYLAMSMQTYRRIAEEAAGFRISPGMQRVNVPALVLAGSRESALIRDSVRAITDVLPGAEGRLATGCGHGWNVEAPALFNATVRAWIRGEPLPRGLEEA